MHQWIRHCADPCTSKMRNGELPPVRKLHRNNITWTNTETVRPMATRYHCVQLVVRNDCTSPLSNWVAAWASPSPLVATASSSESLMAMSRQCSQRPLTSMIEGWRQSACVLIALDVCSSLVRSRACPLGDDRLMICAAPSQSTSTSRRRCSMTPRSYPP